jgi:hypothetical protein
MSARPSFRPGEIYASRDEESGRYQVSKILYADDSVVVARLYTNRFDERPTEIPRGLRLDLTPDELERGEIGIGWGAIAFDAGGFASDGEELILIGHEPLADEELENVEVALDPSKLEEPEGLMSRLTGLFRRRT